MDESTLHTRLRRVERLLYLLVALLVGQYLLDGIDALGAWVTGVVGLGIASVLFAVFVAYRRQNRRSAGA